jgi:hypothetical protein
MKIPANFTQHVTVLLSFNKRSLIFVQRIIDLQHCCCDDSASSNYNTVVTRANKRIPCGYYGAGNKLVFNMMPQAISHNLVL